jgi:hypothetical protein
VEVFGYFDGFHDETGESNMDMCYGSNFIEFYLAKAEWSVDLVLLLTHIVFTLRMSPNWKVVVTIA